MLSVIQMTIIVVIQQKKIILLVFDLLNNSKNINCKNVFYKKTYSTLFMYAKYSTISAELDAERVDCPKDMYGVYERDSATSTSGVDCNDEVRISNKIYVFNKFPFKTW